MKKGKFVLMLTASNADIKQTRAEQLGEDALLEMESFTNTLKKDVSSLRNKITRLTDLAPDNTYSLRPGSPDFNAARWVKELHSSRVELAVKEEELDIALQIQEEFFGEEEEPVKAKPIAKKKAGGTK